MERSGLILNEFWNVRSRDLLRIPGKGRVLRARRPEKRKTHSTPIRSANDVATKTEIKPIGVSRMGEEANTFPRISSGVIL